MSPNIPPRTRFGDSFEGSLCNIAGTLLLAQAPIEGSETLHRGSLLLRYGIEYLGKPQYSIVPDLVALDYGDGFSGEEAWDFIYKRSNLYPRADVFGYRNDGVDDMIVVKKLDLMQAVHVLAFAHESSTMPLAKVTALIATDTSAITPRILTYLPHYASLADWQAQHDR